MFFTITLSAPEQVQIQCELGLGYGGATVTNAQLVATLVGGVN